MSTLADIGKKFSRRRYRIAVEYEKRDKKGLVRRTWAVSRWSLVDAEHAREAFIAGLEPEVKVLKTSIIAVQVGNEKPLPKTSWNESLATALLGEA